MSSLKFSGSHVKKQGGTGEINFNNLFHVLQHIQSIISNVTNTEISMTYSTIHFFVLDP